MGSDYYAATRLHVRDLKVNLNLDDQILVTMLLTAAPGVANYGVPPSVDRASALLQHPKALAPCSA